MVSLSNPWWVGLRTILRHATLGIIKEGCHGELVESMVGGPPQHPSLCYYP